MSFEANESHHDSCEGCSACEDDCMDDHDYCGRDVAYNQFKSIEDALTKAGFSYVGNGMFRTVYMRGGVVIKVPHNEDGKIDNRTEATAWKKYRDKATSLGVYLAPCRLLSNGCLMMVTVSEDDIDWENLPAWARSVDCNQVGMYKDRLVAYDYALEIPEREEWEKEWKTRSNWFHNNRLKHLIRRSRET